MWVGGGRVVGCPGGSGGTCTAAAQGNCRMDAHCCCDARAPGRVWVSALALMVEGAGVWGTQCAGEHVMGGAQVQVWYQRKEGSKAGPIGRQQLSALLLQGEVERSTLTWLANFSTEWTPLEVVGASLARPCSPRM